jgi:NAD(P)-dependent dehydrogenase (short-subunit alcohol dehydrogenase family)
MTEFSGQVALVTGAGSGIGAAVARSLAGRGARAVVLLDRDGAAAERLARELGPAARAEAVDVTDAGQVDTAVRRVAAEHGRLDLVVHAAGVDDPGAKQAIATALETGRPVRLTASLADQDWRRVLAVNLDGTFHVVRAALTVMEPQGSGAIVLIGSSAAFDAPVGYPHYAASKAGVHAFAQAVAKEAIAFGIRVNVVAPGPTLTGMAARTPAALLGTMDDQGSRAYASPEQIADSVLYLASGAASNVVGAVLLSNAGRFTV